METAASPSADASLAQSPPKSYSETVSHAGRLGRGHHDPESDCLDQRDRDESISEANTRVNHDVYADCGSWPIALTGGRRGIPAPPAVAAGSRPAWAAVGKTGHPPGNGGGG